MSFKVEVDTSNLKKITSLFQYVNVQINGDLTANELLIIAERTVELARESIPFRTGAARESLQIHADPDGKKVTIGSDGGIGSDGKRRIYLRYLELGTTKMVARPFLFPAVQQALEEFKQRYPLKIKELARIGV